MIADSIKCTVTVIGPVGYTAGSNLYTYVGNDPLDANDPFGLSPDNPQGGWLSSAQSWAWNSLPSTSTVVGTSLEIGGAVLAAVGAAGAPESFGGSLAVEPEAVALTAEGAALVGAPEAAGEGLSAAEQLTVNRAAGAAFEQATAADLAQTDLSVGQQVTLQTESGIRTRLDFLTQDPTTGEIGCIECKASPTAPLTPNQAAAFPEIGQTGGTIMGAGKPGFPGGMQIPPTAVQIIRGQ